MITLFPETMHEGLCFELGPRTVSKEEIIQFAGEFDPAPFHLDEEAARKTPLGGLCASGWHTCAIAMRMMYDSYLATSTSQGAPGVEECNWSKPVYAGDTLTGKTTILAVRQSKSRPENYMIRCHHQLENQHGEPVLTMTNTGIFKSREAFEAA